MHGLFIALSNQHIVSPRAKLNTSLSSSPGYSHSTITVSNLSICGKHHLPISPPPLTQKLPAHFRENLATLVPPNPHFVAHQGHAHLHLLLRRARGARTRSGTLRVAATPAARSRVRRPAGAVVVVRAAVGVGVVVRAVAGSASRQYLLLLPRATRDGGDGGLTCWSSGRCWSWRRWRRSPGRSSGCPDEEGRGG